MVSASERQTYIACRQPMLIFPLKMKSNEVMLFSRTTSRTSPTVTLLLKSLSSKTRGVAPVSPL